MTHHYYWRVVYAFPGVLLGVHIFNLKWSFPYETPKYLLEKGRREEAVELVRVIYKEEFVWERIGELEKHIEMARKGEVEQAPSKESNEVELT